MCAATSSANVQPSLAVGAPCRANKPTATSVNNPPMTAALQRSTLLMSAPLCWRTSATVRASVIACASSGLEVTADACISLVWIGVVARTGEPTTPFLTTSGR